MSAIEALKSPKAIVNFIVLVSSIIVFGCIADKGYSPDGKCYANDSGACYYSVTFGVLSFIASIIITIAIIFSDRIGNGRPVTLLIETVASCLFGLFFFIGFAYLADQWRKSEFSPPSRSTNNIQGAICFSFFLMLLWPVHGFLAWKEYQNHNRGYSRYEEGASSVYSPYQGGDESYQGVAYTNPSGTT